LRSGDVNHILSSRLFTETAYAELADILATYGEARLRSAVNAFLAGDRSGDPKRRGHIQFWRYFRITLEREDRLCVPPSA